MKDQIKEDITGFLEQDSGEFTPLILLDACKAVLRGKISGYSSHLKRARLKELNQEQNWNKALRKKKNEKDEIYTRDIQKKLIFTKQQYCEGGGKARKLLAYRLKKQQVENLIHKIKNPMT